MSTQKKDLAQELAQFLLKGEELKKAANQAGSKTEVKQPKGGSAPAPVPKDDPKEADTLQKTLQKTVVLNDHTSPSALEFDFGFKPEEKAPQDQKPTVVSEELKTRIPVPEFKTNPDQGFKKHFTSQRSNIVFNDVSNLMAGTEAVKVAQARIKAIEKENEQLRGELENLLVSTESLQRRLQELKAEHEGLERKHREKMGILEDEKAVMRTRLNAKENELSVVKKENEELHARFQNDLRKIRVRERELEHRQEILKAEMTNVVSGKDEAILDLKRQLEKLQYEIDNFRAKSADMNAKLAEFYERNARTVKALRLALSVLESGDVDDTHKKGEES